MFKDSDQVLLLSDSKFIKQKEYWLKKLSSYKGETTLLLKNDGERQPQKNAEKLEIPLNAELCQLLMKLSKKNDLSLYIILLSALEYLTYRYTGSDDVVIISPVYIPNISADTINDHSFIRSAVHDRMAFLDLLLGTRQSVLEAYENQDYPTDQLKKTLFNDSGDSGVTNHTSLSNIACLLENIHGQAKGIVSRLKDRLVFSFVKEGEQVKGRIFYNSNAYKKSFLQQVANHFPHLLRQCLENVRVKLSDISFLLPAEKEKLLNDFNDTQLPYPSGKTIPQLFQEQVSKTPDQPALAGQDMTLTYDRLNSKANQLARVLREKGVKPETVVPILAERSIDVAVAIIAILKAGGAYLPVDTDYPPERKKFVLRDSGTQLLLTQKPIYDSHKECLQDTPVQHIIYIDDPNIYRGPSADPEPVNTPDDPVYMIYTSGSTGTPKGTIVEHRNLHNLNVGLRERIYSQYNQQPHQQPHQPLNIALVAPFVFDASVKQIFAALLQGHTLHIVPNQTKTDGFKLAEFYNNNKIDISDGTPSHLRMLMECARGDSCPLNIKHFVIGGEALPKKLVKDFFKSFDRCNIKITNIYGLTECCVDSTAYQVTPQNVDMYDVIPIGPPMPNQQIYILDQSNRLQPPGVPGELCISGDCVSRGYFKRDDLTSQKFIPNPFNPSIENQRLYKTGDLARWLEDGNIEYLGRIDHQVKIRGFRIELGEIENALLKHHAVEAAVVLARDDNDGNKYLCAYYVPAGKDTGAQDTTILSQLKNHLSQTLPDYMIPYYFVQLDAVPLTPSGKVDRKALPEPQIASDNSYVAPANIVEEKLVTIWSQVLGLEKEKISVNANFFELGGHSLKAIILLSRIHKALNVRISLEQIFKAPTIRDLSQLIRGSGKENHVSIEPVEKKEYYPLSSAQKRIYILQRMERESTAYNMPQIIPLQDDTAVEKLEQAFVKLIQRHDSLRTSFHFIADQTVQRVHDHVEFHIAQYNNVNNVNNVSQFVTPFDLSRAPLLRAGLVSKPGGQRLLIVDIHHIISDGVSHQILIDDFLAFFDRRELPPLHIQYKDFSQWQNQRKDNEYIKKQEAYWLDKFNAPGELPVLNLPTDHPRPIAQSFEGKIARFEIDRIQTRLLKDIARQEGVTTFMLLLAVTNIWLSKLSGQEDIIVGTPIAGRRHADLEKIIGMFVNTLALRNSPGSQKSLKQFLKEIKEKTLEDFENQDYQFEDLVDKVAVNRDASRNPIFDVLYTFQTPDKSSRGQSPDNNPEQQSAAQDNRDKKIDTSRREANPVQTSKFDISLNGIDARDKFVFEIEYSTKLFEDHTIDRYIAYFKQIISTVAAQQDIELGRISMLGEQEEKQILCDFNNTTTDYPAQQTIHSLFEEQARETPGQIALVGKKAATGETVKMTYSQLNEAANQVAFELRQKGAAADSIVAVKLNESIEMITGILGILKAGAGYLPIDPGYPEERINYILADGGAKMMVTNQGIQDIADAPRTVSTQSVTSAPSPSSLAYIIYTSGSTGKPKGVMVEHRSVVRLVKNTNFIHMTPNDRLLQTGALSFDASTFEIWGSLLNGSTLYLIDKDHLVNASQLKTTVSENRITVMWMTAALFNHMLQEDIHIFEGLKALLVGGEALSPPHIRRIKEAYPRLKVINGYGPTENTTFSTTYPIDLPVEGNIPIGKPIANSTAYILDKNNQLLPIGVPGELVVGGDGLARGYLNNPELTNQKFTRIHIDKTGKNPGDQSQSQTIYVYRTGDLTRWLPDGNIQFLGRIDHQVKIRGFRIELGEIENCLLKQENITEAVVITPRDDNGDKYLCAYIVSQDPLDPAQCREALSLELPNYMIPSEFITIDKMPLNANGKIDRKALPEPRHTTTQEYTAPRDHVEEKLVAIWAGVLKTKTKIGVNDDFFQLGGHSLHATNVSAKIQDKFNVHLPLGEIFRRSTISKQAEYIKSRIESGDENAPVVRVQDENIVLLGNKNNQPRHLFFIHDGSGEVEGYIEFADRLSNTYNYWGIRMDKSPHFAPINITIEEIASGYVEKIKKIQPHGPYKICGWSMGGTIAVEMARQLEQQDQVVDFLAIVDSPSPGAFSGKATPFTTTSETRLLQSIIGDNQATRILSAQTNLEKWWQSIVDYLGTPDSPFDLDRIKLAIPLRMAEIMPNFRQAGLEEVIYQFNRIRTLENAREKYIPANSIETAAYYFAAKSSSASKNSNWISLFNRPIQILEIEGDHFSIFKKPDVVEFAEQFNNLLEHHEQLN